jgi:hypothetical protein
MANSNTKALEPLMKRAASWPEEAQAELVQSMIEIEKKHLGVYHLDADERAALERSAEDIRKGKFATDEEVAAVFDRYRRP